MSYGLRRYIWDPTTSMSAIPLDFSDELVSSLQDLPPSLDSFNISESG